MRIVNPDPFQPPSDGTVHAVCPHDCPDACSMLAQVAGGRLVQVRGNPGHPVTRGFLCRKLARAPQRVYGPDRLLEPLVRCGPKGSGRFRPVCWEEALATVAARWRQILGEDGPRAILPFWGSGTEGLVHGHLAGRRFFNRLGTLQLERTICTKGGRTGYRYTMGTSMGADPRAAGEARLLIAWGVNLAATGIHHLPVQRAARRAGARTVVINPLRVHGAGSADRVLQPRPGTDAALALAMMQVIVAEGLYDADFVERYTSGFELLRARLAEYPPERAAAITGVPAADIVALARLYAGQPASFIFVGPGCQRHSNGGMTLRTLACLPALTGAWRHRGCGLYFPTSTVFPVELGALEGEALRPNPPQRYNMLELGRLLAGAEPRIRSLYVFDGNPASVLYNQALLRRGLAREDLFTVVHERYLTDTAHFADVILPATTQFEQADLHFSYYHFGVLLNRPAIRPPGQCRSNLDTFAALARVLGLNEPGLAAGERELIEAVLAIDHPALAGITLEALLEHGWQQARIDPIMTLLESARLPTPTARIALWSGEMAARGLDPLPAYVPAREGLEATPALAERYPLQLITPSAHAFLNSNYAQYGGRGAGEHRPSVLIHPADAGPRAIRDGDCVRVFNDRGDCTLWACVSEDVRPGVAVATGQWWDASYPAARNANHTTPDFLEDLAGGSAFNSNLVEIEAAVQAVAAAAAG